MSSLNNFNVEDAALDALDAADLIPVYDNSTGKPSRMTGAQALAMTRSAPTSTTSVSSNGLTVISSAAAGASITLGVPVAGQRKVIAIVHSTSTATNIIASTDLSITFDSSACVAYNMAAGTIFNTLELIGDTSARWIVLGSTNARNSFSFTTI